MCRRTYEDVPRIIEMIEQIPHPKSGGGICSIKVKDVLYEIAHALVPRDIRPATDTYLYSDN